MFFQKDMFVFLYSGKIEGEIYIIICIFEGFLFASLSVLMLFFKACERII